MGKSKKEMKVISEVLGENIEESFDSVELKDMDPMKEPVIDLVHRLGEALAEKQREDQQRPDLERIDEQEASLIDEIEYDFKTDEIDEASEVFFEITEEDAGEDVTGMLEQEDTLIEDTFIVINKDVQMNNDDQDKIIEEMIKHQDRKRILKIKYSELGKEIKKHVDAIDNCIAALDDGVKIFDELECRFRIVKSEGKKYLEAKIYDEWRIIEDHPMKEADYLEKLPLDNEYINSNALEDEETKSDDELFEKAKELIVDGKITVSLIQRKLRIGYNSAAKILDRLLSEGTWLIDEEAETDLPYNPLNAINFEDVVQSHIGDCDNCPQLDCNLNGGDDCEAMVRALIIKYPHNYENELIYAEA